jgi:hypothetical protein
VLPTLGSLGIGSSVTIHVSCDVTKYSVVKREGNTAECGIQDGAGDTDGRGISVTGREDDVREVTYVAGESEW